MLNNFACAAMFRKLPLEIFFINLQRCKATVILPFLTIIRELCISIFCIILQWYTAKVISPFPVNWSVKTTPLSSFLARAGALFGKPLKAIAIYAKTSLVTFLCFLIVFNYFPFTVFNILASFIYGFNASKAFFTQASRFSIKVKRLLQEPTNSVSKLFVFEGSPSVLPAYFKI